MTKRVEVLVAALCGSEGHPLAAPLRAWCGASRAFLVFAETNTAKIRKKVRLAASEGEQGDLLAELAVAALLLHDPRFGLTYEPLGSGEGRGPDFLVRHRTHPAFHAEVTRLRPGGAALAVKLARALADKLGQLPPGGANLLVVAVPEGAVSEDLLDGALGVMGDSGLPPERVRAYQRQRLSALLLCAFAPDWQMTGVLLWLHPQARHPLSPELVRALKRVGVPDSQAR